MPHFNQKELRNIYDAVCMAIGLGKDLPQEMDEHALVIARNKLRVELERRGVFKTKNFHYVEKSK